MVRWYKLTFAISRKRDSRSLQCFTTTINLCPKDLLCSLSWVPLAVLTKVGVGFLRCHFSCYLLARRITFLSGIMRSTGSAFAGAEGKLFLWWKAAKRPMTHSPYLYTRPHGSEGKRAEGQKKKNRIKNQFNNYVSFLSEATRARERSPIAKKLWLSIHLGSHFSDCTSVRPTAPQVHQCEMSHFLACVGDCNLKLLNHIVVN